MKRLIFILLLFPILSFSQEFRSIDWKTNVDNVQIIGVDTFKFYVDPIDYNDKGVGEIGNYFIDYAARAFKIIDSDATTITVVDLEGVNESPQQNQIGRVYQSIVDGDSLFQSIGGVDISVLDELSKWKAVARDNELFGRAINNIGGIARDSILFTQQATKEHTAGMIYFDSVKNNFVLFDNNTEVALDAGKEGWTDVYNNSGADIADGSVVVFEGNGGSHPSIKLARADIPPNMNSRIGVATHDIEYQTYGRMTVWGEVRNYNTSGMSTGQKLWLSPTVYGGLTTEKPSFPNTSILIATVDSVGVNGSINVNVIGAPSNVLGNINNGCFVESFTFSVTSDGTTIKGELVSNAGEDWLIMKFSDGLDTLDLTTPREIDLIAGTDANPQKQYIYVDEATRELAVSTSYWSSSEHIPIAEVVVQSAITVQDVGAIRNQNTNNHVADDNGMGGLDHIRKRIRALYCVWEDGVATTVTGNNITTTGGNAWQMHLQPFDAWDLSTDKAFLPNSPIQNYRIVDELTDITTDASGGILKNKEYSIVLIGIQNSGNDPDQILINMPLGSYNNVSDAILDEAKYSVYTIPSDYRGVAFLIARLTFSNANGVWTLEDTEDLRGSIPNNIAGGGGSSGGGYTTLLELTDFPNAYTGFGGHLMNVSTAENAVEFSDYTTTDLDTIAINRDSIEVLSPIIRSLESGGDTSLWAVDGDNIYNKNIGNTGLGTSSPEGIFHLVNNGKIVKDWLYSANTALVIEDSVNNAIMSFVCNSDKAGRIIFSDKEDRLAGNIKYNHNGDILSFDIDGSTLYSFDSEKISANSDVDITGDYQKNGINLVSQTITNGVIDYAPSEDIVYDSLAAHNVRIKALEDTPAGGTNLGTLYGFESVTVTSSTGTPTEIEKATAVQTGVLAKTDYNNFAIAYTHTGLTNNPHSVSLAQLGYTGATNANFYTLPTAGTSTLGGIKLLFNINGYYLNSDVLYLSDEKLNTSTPLLTDEIAFADATYGNNRKCTISELLALGGGGGSNWTTDASGINYQSGNVGIGRASVGDSKLYVTSSLSYSIIGINPSTGIGVWGGSVDGYGVYGQSTNSYGGFFDGLGVLAEQYHVNGLNTAPTSSTATGTTGEIRYTSSYIYVCVATNTWKRTALTTW